MNHAPTSVYPASYALPWQEIERSEIQETDDELVAYWEAEERTYRETIETYFPKVGPHLANYHHAPFDVTVLRLGTSGLIVGHAPSDSARTVVKPLDDVLNLSGESWTIFQIGERIGAQRLWFNFAGGSYSLEAAEQAGARRAFLNALELLWHVQEPEWFGALTRSLLEAEGVRLVEERIDGVDLVGDVTLDEPGGYRRVERWGYRIIGPANAPLTDAALTEISSWLDENESAVAGCCVVTSGDHSTLGTALRVDDLRLRMLDRPAIVRVVHEHPDVLDAHFAAYSEALARAGENTPPLARTVRLRLKGCPAGHGAYVQYEALGTAAVSEIFGEALGAPRKQKSTDDGVRRPDAIYPIRGAGPFWDRVRSRFLADFVIVDFKNYTAPIDGRVVDDVSKYGTDAVGKLILAVSRAGGDETAHKRAVRLYRDRGICVLVLSDSDLVEMAARRDRAEAPESLLSERLDDLLTSA